MKAMGGFITLEGLDGAGTTTQARMLQNVLEHMGINAVLSSEPTSGPVGSLIRQILAGRVNGRHATGMDAMFDRKALALLFAADRLDHCETFIKPLQKQGFIVISDRYLHSSLAYQTQDAEWDWVVTINKYAVQPDLVVFLDVAPEVAMSRIEGRGAGREIFENLGFQQHVMDAYHKALDLLADENKLIVNGEAPKEDVHSEILQRVLEQFNR